MDFSQLFKTLESIPAGIDRATKQGLKLSAVIVMGRAKGKLGTYQAAFGAYPAWMKLSPETVRRKHMSISGKITQAGKKYLKVHGTWGAGGNDDSPLVDKGHLRQAITTDFSEMDQGIAYVGVGGGSEEQGKGSPSNSAAIHEFGGITGRGHKTYIPPRPYLRPALEESREEIKEAVTHELLKELRSL
jgi:phage gpG-like protein